MFLTLGGEKEKESDPHPLVIMDSFQVRAPIFVGSQGTYSWMIAYLPEGADLNTKFWTYSQILGLNATFWT